MLNCSFWKRWTCREVSCPCAVDGHDRPEEIHHCQLVRTMLERGIGYLRLAGRDEEECMVNIKTELLRRQTNAIKEQSSDIVADSMLRRYWTLDLFPVWKCRG